MSLIVSKADREGVPNFVMQNVWGHAIIAPEATEGKLSCCRLIIPPGVSFPVHIHQEAHLLFCIAGYGFVEYCEAGTTKRFDLAKGDTCYIPNNILHACGSNMGLELLVVNVLDVPVATENRTIEAPLSESELTATSEAGQ